jgi:hypothetical protein
MPTDRIDYIKRDMAIQCLWFFSGEQKRAESKCSQPFDIKQKNSYCHAPSWADEKSCSDVSLHETAGEQGLCDGFVINFTLFGSTFSSKYPQSRQMIELTRTPVMSNELILAFLGREYIFPVD